MMCKRAAKKLRCALKVLSAFGKAEALNPAIRRLWCRLLHHRITRDIHIYIYIDTCTNDVHFSYMRIVRRVLVHSYGQLRQGSACSSTSTTVVLP